LRVSEEAQVTLRRLLLNAVAALVLTALAALVLFAHLSTLVRPEQGQAALSQDIPFRRLP
jgi:hypothetical protein